MRIQFDLRRILVLLLLTLMAAAAAAQYGGDGEGTLTADHLQQQVRPGVSDPSLSSPTTGGIPQVTLVTSQENSVVAAEIAVDFGDDLYLTLGARAPIQKGQKEFSLADLDGLAGGSSASLGLTKVFFKIQAQNILGVCDDFNEGLSVRPINIAEGECSLSALAERGEVWQVRGSAAVRAAVEETCHEFNATGQAAPLLVEAGECTLSALSGLGEKWRNAAAGRIGKGLEEVCSQHNDTPPEGWIDVEGRTESNDDDCHYQNLKRKGAGWPDRALDAVDFSAAKFLSFKVTAKTDNFEFADPETLETKKSSENSYAGTLTLGMLTRRGRYFGLNLRSEKAYKGGKATEVCRPIGDTGGLSCSDLALAGPTRTDTETAQLEFRTFPSDWIGINPKVTRDFENKVTGYQVLVYFLQDKKKGLNGGLDFGYRSDTDDFTIRAFVGRAFKLIP